MAAFTFRPFRPPYPSCYFKQNGGRNLTATTCPIRPPACVRTASLRRVARRWFSTLASKHSALRQAGIDGEYSLADPAAGGPSESVLSSGK